MRTHYPKQRQRSSSNNPIVSVVVGTTTHTSISGDCRHGDCPCIAQRRGVQCTMLQSSLIRIWMLSLLLVYSCRCMDGSTGSLMVVLASSLSSNVGNNQKITTNSLGRAFTRATIVSSKPTSSKRNFRETIHSTYLRESKAERQDLRPKKSRKRYIKSSHDDDTIDKEFEEDDDHNNFDSNNNNNNNNNVDDDDMVEEAVKVVDEIVGMFGGDNTTLDELVKDLQKLDVSPTRSPELTQSPVKSKSEPPETQIDQSDPLHDENKDETISNDDDLFDEKIYNNQPMTAAAATPSTAFAIFATLMGVFAMIFTAWQMSDNPDGIFASLCRLIITSFQLILRILCSPCRKCMPCCYTCGGSGNGYHEPYGHMPVSTMDYGYKDPALELS